MNVVRLWSPFATASGSVALAVSYYFNYCVTCFIIAYGVVLSTRPLNPRDETAYHRCGFRDGVDFVAELRLVRPWTGATLY